MSLLSSKKLWGMFFFLIVGLTFSVFPRVAFAYDRSQAARYAEKWWNTLEGT